MRLSENYVYDELALSQGITVSKLYNSDIKKDKEVRMLISKGVLVNDVVESVEVKEEVKEEVVKEKPKKKATKKKKKVSKK